MSADRTQAEEPLAVKTGGFEQSEGYTYQGGQGAMVYGTLEEAVEELKKNPDHPVRAHLDSLDVELRAVGAQEAPIRLGDALAQLGPWEGESAEELIERLAEARRAGGSAEPLTL
jgi:hypothetical protein